MHAAIEALFAEHKTPKHCAKHQALSIARPILQLAAQAQAQITGYRALLLDAETAEDLPDEFRGKLEMFQQTLDSMDVLTKKLISDGREIGKAFTQWDRYMEQAHPDFDRVAKRIAAGAPGGSQSDASASH